MTNRVFALARNQLAIANQADRAITLQREPLGRLGLLAWRFLCSAGIWQIIAKGFVGPSRDRIAQKGLELAGPEVALMHRHDVTIRGNDDRGRQRTEVEREGQLLVHVGTKLERNKRLFGALHDRRMGKRLTLHARAVGAPGPGKLNPQEPVRGPGFLECAAVVVTPGDRFGLDRLGGMPGRQGNQDEGDQCRAGARPGAGRVAY